MPQDIELGANTVTIKGESHPIKFGETLKPNDDYEIALYTFEDEKGNESDGCVFRIKPGGSTSVMRITREGYMAQRIAVKGSGWFYGISPTGENVWQEIGPGVEENPLIELGAGWVDCFIAGPDGLEVADVSTPPFEPSMEEELEYGFVPDPSSLNKESFAYSAFWRELGRRKFNDLELNFDNDNYIDLWDIISYSPTTQATIIYQRLRDAEVKHFYPKIYKKFVEDGPRREECGTYKPNDMNEHEYGDWLFDREHEEGKPPSKNRPLTNYKDLLQKARAIVKAANLKVSEDQFRLAVTEHMAQIVVLP